MSLTATPVRHTDGAEKFTQENFAKVFVDTLLRNPGTELTSPNQAAEFYVGLCALQPRFHSVYLANQGYNGVDSIHLHGEYGYVYLVNMGPNEPPAMMISISWCVANDAPDLFRTAIGLLRECMRLQLPTWSLLQWFDTMSRLRSGKRTSPHFDPSNALNKILHRVRPMLALMDESGKNFTEICERGASRA